MSIVDTFQDLLGQVHEALQPVIIAAAGAVPFVEGHGAAIVGVLGGMNVVLATVAAILGNFVCVTVLVLLSARARGAVISQRQARAARRTGAGVVAGAQPSGVKLATRPEEGALEAEQTQAEMRAGSSPRRVKFQRAFARYGVPGVSLLGPLLLPTQFTATMLAASGVRTGRILLWQGIAIVAWTVITAVVVSGVIGAVG